MNPTVPQRTASEIQAAIRGRIKRCKQAQEDRQLTDLQSYQASLRRDMGVDVTTMPPLSENDARLADMMQKGAKEMAAVEGPPEWDNDNQEDISALALLESRTLLQEKLAKAKTDLLEKREKALHGQSEEQQRSLPLEPKPAKDPEELQAYVRGKIDRCLELQETRTSEGKDGPVIAVGTTIPSAFWAKRM